MDAIVALRTRRAHGHLDEPAPTEAHLTAMLEAAAAAPDHGNLRPFRFTILRGEGMDAFGAVLERAYLARCEAAGDEPVPAKATKERTKLRRAPLVIVVSAKRQPSGKITWSDQRDAAVAAAENLVVAAHALGYGAMWRTGVPCEDPIVKAELGLAEADAIVGFIYIGTAATPKPPRDVDLTELVSEYSP